jgi:hypothetical protein
MGTIISPIFGLLYLAAAAWLFFRAWRQKNTIAGLFLGITILGLGYDSLVVFLGTSIGRGTTLESMNRCIFWSADGLPARQDSRAHRAPCRC